MSRLVIQAQGLGKEYVIGQRERGNESFREMLTSSLTAPFLRLQKLRGKVAGDERFWALKDVNFEVNEGEIVGIIGRNGAGKSTVLKILSRITAPTEGKVEIRGRVASLLEVGTGFHHELTGRENIELNGAILGMSQREIKRKFDEIVAFAEVEKFLDTPVKRYSSGMYVRLAFSVAAHLDPEILLIDEVLAVGDVGFQKKCLNKMGQVSGEGRTVLFVSHNQQAVRALCSRGILLVGGRLVTDGPVSAVLQTYAQRLRSAEFHESVNIADVRFRRGNGAVRFTAIKVTDGHGQETSSFSLHDSLRFDMGYRVLEAVDSLRVSIILFVGYPKTAVSSIYKIVSDLPIPAGERGRIIIDLPHLNLRPNEYSLYFWLGKSETVPYDVVDDIVPPITIETRDDFDQLGYNPANPTGYFDLAAKIRWCRGSTGNELSSLTAASSVAE
jgi:lipopolysaccharide transport system ATP-binding protein